jgi:hypothetical protein
VLTSVGYPCDIQVINDMAKNADAEVVFSSCMINNLVSRRYLGEYFECFSAKNLLTISETLCKHVGVGNLR